MNLQCKPLRLLLVVWCLLLLAHRCAYTQQQAWKTQTVTLHYHNSSMRQALEQFAVQTGVSILADGVPASKPLNLDVQTTADSALTQIADTFDYSWTVSKSGIVLMRKRFTDEHERPEIVVDEMRASIRNILGFLQTLYTPEPEQSMTSSFRRLAANLSQEQAKMLNSSGGLAVSTLSAPLRDQATHIIYMDKLDALSTRLAYLDKLLAALPDARLAQEDILMVGGKSRPYIVLAFKVSAELQPVLLWPTAESRTDALPHETSNAAQPLKQPAVLNTSTMEASTIDEALSRLQQRFQIKILLLPKMNNTRRIQLILQPTDASQAQAAFAEMYAWRMQRTKDACILYRQAVEPPRGIEDLGRSILKALPSDVERCLFIRPVTLEDKPYKDVHDIYPQLPGAGDARPHASSKISLQQQAALRSLKQSLSEHNLLRAAPYAALANSQQQDIVHFLWCETAMQLVDDLWRITYKPPDYFINPLQARLVHRGDDSFGIVGGKGGAVFVRQGPSSN